MFALLIEADELAGHVGDPDWLIVDCRFQLMQPQAGRDAYGLGHIPGAVYADLNRDLAAPVTSGSGRHPLPRASEFGRTLGRWGVMPDTQVVVYDERDSAIAVRLWWMLRNWIGHTRVAVLNGGMAAWQSQGYTLDRRPAAARRGYYPVQENTKSFIQTPQLLQALQHNAVVLIDARASERFAGTYEPIDPVAGHIPGADNIPYVHNLDETGRFLPAAQLRERFQPVLSDDKMTVHMCGSGVTACHNMLAMAIAGLTESKLYPGSWSEWCQDGNRPVTNG